MTLWSSAGVAVNAAAGAPRDGWPAALRQPQPASTSPELAQPPYALISEGSLIKVGQDGARAL